MPQSSSFATPPHCRPVDIESGEFNGTLQPISSCQRFPMNVMMGTFALCAVTAFAASASSNALFTTTGTTAVVPVVAVQNSQTGARAIASQARLDAYPEVQSAMYYSTNVGQRTQTSGAGFLGFSMMVSAVAATLLWALRHQQPANAETIALMATISAKDVQALRQESGAGMMDCKKALTENDGDFQQALDWLRKKGITSADKKASRVAAEGAIVDYIHMGSRIGVLVEVNCETDFVARGDVFQTLAKDIAMQIAACEGVTVVSTEDVDPAWVAKERSIEMEKEDLKSKPEQIRGKIVDGRIEKRVKEVALLEQPFIKDQDKTVSQVIKEAIAATGENIKIRRFMRFNLGEGLEKRADNFAEEVAAQASAAAKAPPAAPAAPAAPAPAEEAKAPAAPAVQVSAKDVSELRKRSGAGMMDCKKALAENNGDIEASAEWLRKKGLVSADKKAGRIAAEGLVHAYIHMGSRLGVLVEVNCETDFVARSDAFKQLVADIAMQAAASDGITVVAPEDVDQAWLAKERAIEMEKEDLQSKPEQIRGKIVDGRMQKRVKEVALLEQPFIKDQDKTVGEVLKASVATIGENIKIRRFSKFVLGEGLEKRSTDFAAEVAAAAGQV